MLLSKHFIYSHHTSPVVRSRRLAPAPLPGCCCRAAAVSVCCQARVKKAKKAAPKRSGFGKNKGFGGKPQEDWESQLLPPYRVYYKQGYKPPRFQGTLKPKVFEGTCLWTACRHIYDLQQSGSILPQSLAQLTAGYLLPGWSGSQCRLCMW
jgi:hypothetical protein